MKNRLLIFSCLSLFLWSAAPSVGQSYLNLDVAQNFSTFKFSYNPILTDDNATSSNPEYSQITSTAFGLGYKYLHTTGLFAGGGLNFRKAGASLVYKKTNYLWNLQYVDIKAGIGYQYDRWRIKPYASLTPYYAYLLNAKQSIGSNFYDIKADKALKGYDFGLFLSLGANVTLSQYTSIYAEYSYNLGLKNVENADEQYLYNRGFAVKVGLSISISNFKKMQDQIALQQKQQEQMALDEAESGLQPSQFQLAGAKANAAPTKANSTENESKNTDIEKITSPGTVGWSRNDPASAPAKTKNVVTEATSNDNQLAKSNTSEPATNTKVNNTAQTQASGNTTKTTNVTEPGKSTSGISNTQGANPTAEITGSGNSNTAKNTSTSQTNSAPSGNANENKTTQPAEYKIISAPNTQSTTPSSLAAASEKAPSGSETSKPKANVETNAKKAVSDDKIAFKVQLTAVKNPLRDGHPILKNIKGDIKAERGRDGWMRYYLGDYQTYEEAQKELKKIKAKGIADGGFIVAFKNGKKITVAEAKEILK